MIVFLSLSLSLKNMDWQSFVDARFRVSCSSTQAFQENYDPKVLDVGHRKEDNDIYLCTYSPLPSGALLLSASLMAEVRALNAAEPFDIEMAAMALLTVLTNRGALNIDSAERIPHLFNYLEVLQPRLNISIPRTGAHQIELLKDRVVQNCFESYDEQGRRGLLLFGLPSFFNHSCVPNVYSMHRAELRCFEFYAIRDIPAGEELCISYLPFPIDLKSSRSSVLKFDCACQACTDNLIPSRAYAALSRPRPATVACWQCGMQPMPFQRPLLRCSGCSTALYCSKQCQSDNWKLAHNEVCRLLRS